MRAFRNVLENLHANLSESLKAEALDNPDIGMKVYEKSMSSYLLIDLSRFDDAVKRLEAYPEEERSNEWNRYLRMEAHRDALGMVLAGFRVDNGPVDPCWEASTISYAAAHRGYGPAMYEMIMAQHGTLASSRASVSPEARSVWNRFQSRTDITTLPFDDVLRPKTIPTKDDCTILHKADHESVNFAYQLSPDQQTKATGILDRLIANMAAREKKNGVTIGNLDTVRLVTKIFDLLY